MRRLSSTWPLLLAASLSACAEPPTPQTPDIPSREEVFETERLSKPAPRSSIAAVLAYHEKVCAPRQPLSPPEEPPRGRVCRFHSPLEELQSLERLRAATPATAADLPAIIDRTIATWIQIQHLTTTQCTSFTLPPSPTVADIEDAQKNLLVTDDFRRRAFTEPQKLCAELRTHHPSHRIKAPCPQPPDPPDSPRGDWF